MFGKPGITPCGELLWYLHVQSFLVATAPSDARADQLEKLIGCWLIAPHWVQQ